MCSTKSLIVVILFLDNSINPLTAIISNLSICHAKSSRLMKNLCELISNITSYILLVVSVKVAFIFLNCIVCCFVELMLIND